MNDDTNRSDKSAEREAREKRLAEALRANLRRRKAAKPREAKEPRADASGRPDKG